MTDSSSKINRRSFLFLVGAALGKILDKVADSHNTY